MDASKASTAATRCCGLQCLDVWRLHACTETYRAVGLAEGRKMHPAAQGAHTAGADEDYSRKKPHISGSMRLDLSTKVELFVPMKHCTIASFDIKPTARGLAGVKKCETGQKSDQKSSPKANDIRHFEIQPQDFWLVEVLCDRCIILTTVVTVPC